MTFEQIVSLLELNETKADSLKQYIEEQSKITPEKANEWISEKGSEGYKWFRPLVDREVSKGVDSAIENFKSEKLEALVAERVKELNPDVDPKDQKVIELEKKIKQMESEGHKKELKSLVLEQTKGKLYEGFNFDSLIGADRDETIANCNAQLEAFMSHMKPFEEAKAKIDIKTNPPGAGNGSPTPTDLKSHLDGILNN